MFKYLPMKLIIHKQMRIKLKKLMSLMLIERNNKNPSKTTMKMILKLHNLHKNKKMT